MTTPTEALAALDELLVKLQKDNKFIGEASMWTAARCADFIQDNGPAIREALQGWRAIETAPKDGVTPLLVHDMSEGDTYMAIRPIDCPDDAAATMFGHIACYPTHWRPLPAPPTAEGE